MPLMIVAYVVRSGVTRKHISRKTSAARSTSPQRAHTSMTALKACTVISTPAACMSAYTSMAGCISLRCAKFLSSERYGVATFAPASRMSASTERASLAAPFATQASTMVATVASDGVTLRLSISFHVAQAPEGRERRREALHVAQADARVQQRVHEHLVGAHAGALDEVERAVHVLRGGRVAQALHHDGARE